MKFTFSAYHIVIIFAVVLLGIVCYPRFFGGPVSINEGTYITENTSPPIDPEIPTDLPHDKYVVLKEKAQHVRDIKNGDWLNGGGNQFGYIIGTYQGLICDTCTVANTKLESAGKKQYYITLPGWQLKQGDYQKWYADSTILYVEKGQSYIRKTVVDRAEKVGRDWNYYTHFKAIPVKFRYNRQGNYVMIPVSKLAQQICYYISLGIFILFVAFWFFLILQFIRFVISLSKGQAFTDDNIGRLKIIAFILIGYPVIMFLLAVSMRLIFSSYLTSDVALNPKVYSDSWKTLCAGIVFLLLFKAFKQGAALKEEHDLTV